MENNTTVNNDKDMLSEEQVWDVLQFAKSMQPYYNNVFSPDMINNRMQSIGMNPSQATTQQLEQALANPKNNEDNLIHYSQAFELGDMVYKRLLGYVGNLASFDLTYEPVNATVKDLDSPAYKKDLKIVEDYLYRFNHRKEFKKVLRQLVRQEVYYSVYREDGVAYTLQDLPQDYCKITQKFDFGLLFDFNMNWFLQTGIDINSYPPVFKRMYNDYLSSKNPNYTPSADLHNRNGLFSYWVQTSPDDNFWMWKFNPDIITKVPYFAPMFPDLAMKPLMRSLQKNIYVLQAQKIMVGLIPLLKDSKSGSATNNLAISADVMGKFVSLLKSGLDESVKVSGVPFEDIKILDFNGGTNNGILRDYTQTTIAMSGVNSRLLFNNDKSNALETKLSASIDEFLTTYIYPYFEDFLNFFINRNTKRFRFAFHLEGTEFPTNREERFENQMRLCEKGMVMDQKIAASLGMNPRQFELQIAMTKAKGFVQGLTPIVNASQMSGKDMETGRPKKSDSKLTDSGMDTRSGGYNEEE